MKIEIPDFKKMSDEELHGWEFEVYKMTPELQGNLDEVIGIKATQEYYQERGKRLDLKNLVSLQEQIDVLVRDKDEIINRLTHGTSGQHYFGDIIPK